MQSVHVMPPFAVGAPAKVRAPVVAMKSVPVLPMFSRMFEFRSMVPAAVNAGRVRPVPADTVPWIVGEVRVLLVRV